MKSNLRILVIDTLAFGAIGYITPPMELNEVFILGSLLLAIKLNNYWR